MNEDRYINPILEAMARTANMQQERRRLEYEQANAAQDRKIRQQLADQAEEQIQNAKEYQHGMLDIANETAKQQHEMHALNAIQVARNLVAGGVKLPQIGGSGQPVPGMPAMAAGGVVQIPGTNTQIPSGMLPSPEEVARINAQGIAAQKQAEIPYQMQMLQAQHDFGLDLQKSSQAFQSSLEDKKLAAEKVMHQMDAQSRYGIAAMETSARTKLFGLEHGLTQEGIQSGIMQGLTGMRKFQADNPYDLAVTKSMNEMGARPLDPKDADTLKNLNGLNEAFDKMQTFINNNLSDSTLGAIGTGIMGKMPYSDIKNQYDSIKSYALNIGKALEAQTGGRVLSKQLDLDLDSMISPGTTKAQANAKLQGLRDRYVNQQNNVIMTGMPDFQKQAIVKAYGLKTPTPTGTPNPGNPGTPKPGVINWGRDANGLPVPLGQ
jgi:hypothetical protein